jgi:integrase
MLTSVTGKPWTSGGFQQAWRAACKAAGITGVTFHDLRGTAVTRLAVVGCTEAEIAYITGHSLRDVRSILDAARRERDQKARKRNKNSQLNSQLNESGTIETKERPAKSNS